MLYIRPLAPFAEPFGRSLTHLSLNEACFEMEQLSFRIISSTGENVASSLVLWLVASSLLQGLAPDMLCQHWGRSKLHAPALQLLLLLHTFRP